MAGRPVLVVLVALWALGCGKRNGTQPTDSGTDGEGGECHLGELCTPFEWSCDEEGIPVECSAGGDAWIPRDPCPEGQSCDPGTGWCECGPCEVVVEDECRKVGPVCADGWVDDGECGCGPILDDCAGDEIPVIGGGCRRVGARDDCGEGTWGNIPVDPDTVYVDMGYPGGDSDGTVDRPFTTIGEAVASVPVDAPRRVAVAAGTYGEAVVLDNQVALHGRCPSMVTLQPPSGAWGLRITSARSSVSSLTIDSGYRNTYSLRIDGVEGVMVEDVVLLSGVEAGILCRDCVAAVGNVTILNVNLPTASLGAGILARTWETTTCSLAVSASDIAHVKDEAILAHDCDLRVENCRLSDAGWEGIRLDLESSARSLTVTGNVITDVAGVGICAAFNDLPQLADPVVTDNIVSSVAYNSFLETSTGIWIDSSIGHSTVSRNLVQDVEIEGIIATFLSFEAEGNRVVDARYGGMYLYTYGGEGRVVGNTVDSVVKVGIFLGDSSTAILENNAVRNVLLDEDGEAMALAAMNSGDPSIRSNLVESEFFGVSVLECEGEAVIEANLVRSYLQALTFVDMIPGSECTIAWNRVLDSAMAVTSFGVDNLLVSDNRIGPLTWSWSDDDEPGATVALGLMYSTATVERNSIRVSSPVPGDVWSHGILINHVSGQVRDNHVAGNGLIGVAYTTEGRFAEDVVEILDNTVVGSNGQGIAIRNALDGSSISVSGNRIAGISDETWPDGRSYGDGLGLLICFPGADITVTENVVVGSARAGLFVSGATATILGNEFTGNAISMAWQDGAELTLGDNVVQCNTSDMPWVDEGMDVPDPPSVTLPGM